MIEKLIPQFFQLYFWIYIIILVINILTIVAYPEENKSHKPSPAAMGAIGLTLFIMSWKFI